MDAKKLTEALRGRWHGRYGTARCPAHADRSPSLSVAEGRDGKVLVKCFGGCEQRHVIDALRQVGLWAGHVDSAAAPTEAERQAQRKRDAERERDQQRRDAFVQRTWRETWAAAVPASGSPIEAWFRARGIDPERLDLDRLPLRWSARCPRGKELVPAMLGLMTNAATGEAVGVHRTFLLADGTAKAFGKDSRKMLGRAGVIRLSPDDEVTLGLGVCEGIETGLQVMAAGWRPIWACGSARCADCLPSSQRHRVSDHLRRP